MDDWNMENKEFAKDGIHNMDTMHIIGYTFFIVSLFVIQGYWYYKINLISVDPALFNHTRILVWISVSIPLFISMFYNNIWYNPCGKNTPHSKNTYICIIQSNKYALLLYTLFFMGYNIYSIKHKNSLNYVLHDWWHSILLIVIIYYGFIY